ncbi:MAG: phage portal protein [Elsteraceae bacterium]
MKWSEWLRGQFARKQSAAGAALAAGGGGQPRWTPDPDYSVAEEGDVQCVVAYRCIREIAKGAASAPWRLHQREQLLARHPLLDLLARPNPIQGGAELFEAFFAYHQIAGNAWLEAVGPDDGPPRELYALRPDRMTVTPGPQGLPQGYSYNANGQRLSWRVDPLTGQALVLHFRDFHPLDDWQGLSPLRAAAAAIDQFNAASAHNAALLQNGARPTGALLFRTDPGGETLSHAERVLAERFQSPRHAGKPLVLGGDAEWLELGLSPRDMDFNAMLQAVSRNICGAFGVPHILVLPGEATFANRQDARLELWEHTILPLVWRLCDALNNWLTPRFGQDLRLSIDVDAISALHPRRQLRWAMLNRADFLTVNEKRAAVGYPPVPGGDAAPGAGNKT